MMCGGDISVFIDVMESPKLIIIGGGKIGYPLAKIADILGFRVTVVDSTEEVANKERFPMAEEIIVNKDLAKALDQVKVNPNDYVVILTGNPHHDYIALKKMAKKNLAYLGFLGSPVKTKTLLEKLKTEEGIDLSKKKIFHSPVGLNIYAVTPEEIALSILAEIVKERRSL